MIIWTDGDPSACSYAMDASESTITGLGYAGRLALSNGDQTGTYTVQTGLLTDKEYVAGSTTSAVDFASGRKTIEWLYSAPSITGGAGATVLQMDGATFTNPMTVTTIITCRVLVRDDGTYTANVLLNGSTVYTASCSATGRFTVIMHASAGRVTVKLNGVTLLLSSSTYTAQDALMGCSVKEFASLSGAHIGKLASWDLVSDSRRIVYGDGTDKCGNAITPSAIGTVLSSASDGVSTDVTESGKLWTVKTGATNATWHKAESAFSRSVGKWYYEVEVIWDQYIDGREPAIGIAPSGTATTSADGGTSNAGDGGRLQYFGSGEKRSGGTYEAYGDPFLGGDIIGIAWDADARTVTAYKNGVSQGVMFSSVPAGGYVPHLCRFHAITGGGFRLASVLTYLPSGYAAWG